jgi:hypothetical protein
MTVATKSRPSKEGSYSLFSSLSPNTYTYTYTYTDQQRDLSGSA